MNDFKTYIDANDIEKISEFYRNGFYLAGVMLVMELDLGSQKLEERDNIELYDNTNLSEYLAANGKGFGTPDPIDTIEKELRYENANIYVLREKGKIVSSVTVWDESVDMISTENIFTIPKFRGRGYAMAVLSKALMDAINRGMKKARLTVYSTDLPAIKLYDKMGYKITKVLQEFRHE